MGGRCHRVSRVTRRRFFGGGRFHAECAIDATQLQKIRYSNELRGLLVVDALVLRAVVVGDLVLADLVLAFWCLCLVLTRIAQADLVGIPVLVPVWKSKFYG